MQLPNTPVDYQGRWHAPDRLVDNINTGYAILTTWTTLVQGGAPVLKQLVEAANAKPSLFIANSRPMMTYNPSPPWHT